MTTIDYSQLTTGEFDALCERLGRARRMWWLAQYYTITAHTADAAEAQAMSEEMYAAFNTLFA